MRVLLYIPCYTVDRDAQSLRITQFASVLGSRGWRFDIITTPTFLFHDQAFRVMLQHVHNTYPHLRVFLTHPAIIATLRHRLLYRSGLPAATVSQGGQGIGPTFYRRLVRQLYGG